MPCHVVETTRQADDFTTLKICHSKRPTRPRPRQYPTTGQRILRSSVSPRLYLTTLSPKISRPIASAVYTHSNQSSPQSSHSSYGLSSPSSQSSPATSCGQLSQRVSSPPPRDHFLASVSFASSQQSSRSYHLEVVQHAEVGAEFGTSGLLSRLPITPPIVARLTVREGGTAITPESELPFLIAHLSLFSGDGAYMVDMGSNPSGGASQAPPQRLLYGNLVSMAYKLTDLQGNPGLFFLFPDVSIRWRGNFQIAISLLRLSMTDSSGTTSVGRRGQLLAQARTRPFNVYPSGEYTAAPMTRLTQLFIRQGASMFNYPAHS